MSNGRFGIEIVTLIAPASEKRIANIAGSKEGFNCLVMKL